jgi:hypothetical protein
MRDKYKQLSDKELLKRYWSAQLNCGEKQIEGPPSNKDFFRNGVQTREDAWQDARQKQLVWAVRMLKLEVKTVYVKGFEKLAIANLASYGEDFVKRSVAWLTQAE